MAGMAAASWLDMIRPVGFVVLLLAVGVLASRVVVLRRRLLEREAQLVQVQARVQALATRDDVTGLVNRRQVEEVLRLEHQRCTRSGRTFCIAVIDVDPLRAIEQAHGHAAGNEVLRRFAAEARDAIRISDVLARWDGGQFMLLMTDTRAPLGRLGVDRLRDRTGRLTAPLEGVAQPLTFCAGLTEHRAGEAVGDTLQRAEQALAHAKSQGCDRITML
jgi:diguanylate cyclase (GGDEF)-like protein